MKITNIPKIFSPSNARLDIDQRFHRVGEWTIGGVNCSWMIKGFFEPTSMANLKDKPTTITEETISETIKTASFGTEKLAFDEKAIYLTEELPVACLLADNAYIKIYINAYYLSFFLKVKTKNEITFWGKENGKMVIVRENDNIIGAVGIIKINEKKEIVP